MGITWICEFVSTLFGSNSPYVIPAVLDFITRIQGVIIFVVFVCKRDVLSMISKKYSPKLYNKFFATKIDESTKTKETELVTISEWPVESVKDETTTTKRWALNIIAQTVFFTLYY